MHKNLKQERKSCTHIFLEMHEYDSCNAAIHLGVLTCKIICSLVKIQCIILTIFLQLWGLQQCTLQRESICSLNNRLWNGQNGSKSSLCTLHCQTPHFGNINFKMSNKNCSCFVHVLSVHNTQWLQHTNISHYEPIPETLKEHFRED